MRFDLRYWAGKLPTVVILAIAAAASVSTAGAQEQALSGAGAQTCGQFAQAYRLSPHEMENFYFSWAQGVMSGRNMVFALHKEPIRNLASRSIDQQQAFIRDYCNNQPLEHFAGAVMALYHSLPFTK